METCVGSIKEFLSNIPEGSFKGKLWPKFKFFALIRPEENIFPVRTVYNGTTLNIGMNYLTSKGQI